MPIDLQSRAPKIYTDLLLWTLERYWEIVVNVAALPLGADREKASLEWAHRADETLTKIHSDVTPLHGPGSDCTCRACGNW